MPGRFSNPLSPAQIRDFEIAAEQADHPIRGLVGHCILHTGLRTGEIVHMRPHWVSEDTDGMVIEIPKKEECIGGVGPVGSGNREGKNLNDRGRPCTKCRNSSDREENQWKVKTPASIREIQIPSDQQPLIDLLKSWKRGFSCLPLSHSGVNYNLGRIAEEAGMDRKVTPQDLRHTHAMMLSREGMSETQIMERMGYSSIESVQQFVVDPK